MESFIIFKEKKPSCLLLESNFLLGGKIILFYIKLHLSLQVDVFNDVHFSIIWFCEKIIETLKKIVYDNLIRKITKYLSVGIL